MKTYQITHEIDDRYAVALLVLPDGKSAVYVPEDCGGEWEHNGAITYGDLWSAGVLANPPDDPDANLKREGGSCDQWAEDLLPAVKKQLDAQYEAAKAEWETVYGSGEAED